MTASASAPFPGGQAASEADQRFCLVRSVGGTWLLSGSAGWCGLPACWGQMAFTQWSRGPSLATVSLAAVDVATQSEGLAAGSLKGHALD